MASWVDNFVEVQLDCPYCNEKFITRQFIFDGTVDEWCCGPDCYEEYFSKKNIRDRKINSILNIDNDVL